MPTENELPNVPAPPLKIAYLTAGAAGMICGACLHDNTLARALMKLGHDVQLVPLYTPIRTDEEDVSRDQIFYGGINMFLQQKSRLFRWLPKRLDRWLDQKWILNWAAGRSVKIDPDAVADLALSILRGTEGFQKKEVERLAEWLSGTARPDVIVFSNMLTAGCVPEIKRRMRVPVVVTLQGDDIFLRELPEPQRSQSLAQISRLAASIDGFITHSRFYADAMSRYLQLDRARIAVVPLGVDVEDFQKLETEAKGSGVVCESRDPGSEPTAAIDSRPPLARNQSPTVGYLARLAPEKGLHVLAEAFVKLRQMPGMERARLRVAGWLGERHRPYVDGVFNRLRGAGLADAFEYAGEVDRNQKLEFLASLDVLAVPTTYQEPKGLFVLEALAAGAAVAAPDHGAFPELLGDTGGGVLHRPDDAQHLAERLHELLSDSEKRRRLATEGRQSVVSRRNAREMAVATVDALRDFITRAG
jgi:glycosyltransferase involved in cell wall biosynthesis